MQCTPIENDKNLKIIFKKQGGCGGQGTAPL